MSTWLGKRETNTNKKSPKIKKPGDLEICSSVAKCPLVWSYTFSLLIWSSYVYSKISITLKAYGSLNTLPYHWLCYPSWKYLHYSPFTSIIQVSPLSWDFFDHFDLYWHSAFEVITMHLGTLHLFQGKFKDRINKWMILVTDYEHLENKSRLLAMTLSVCL